MDICEIREKLLATGWQSWSPRSRSPLKIPAWNDPPIPDNYFPDSLGKRTTKKSIIGWCSWYAFGPFINAEKIIRQAEWFSWHKEIPIEYILIDGGWVRWKNPVASLKEVLIKIQKLGLKPGIWLAPFNKNNKLGIDDLLNLGFKLIKLDYLYRAYKFSGLTSQEAGSLVRGTLLRVKNNYPDVYTIACGCPLLPAINVVDSMRIGPDIIDPIFGDIPLWNSLINSYKLGLVKNNIERRLWTRKFWNLDPDVFVCRKSLGLSDSQIISLQKLIKEVSGNVFLGDDMTKLNEERIKKFVLPLFK